MSLEEKTKTRRSVIDGLSDDNMDEFQGGFAFLPLLALIGTAAGIPALKKVGESAGKWVGKKIFGTGLILPGDVRPIYRGRGIIMPGDVRPAFRGGGNNIYDMQNIGNKYQMPQTRIPQGLESMVVGGVNLGINVDEFSRRVGEKAEEVKDALEQSDNPKEFVKKVINIVK